MDDIKEALLMDDFDDCIAGVVRRCGQPTIICYDRDKVLKQLVDSGMTDEEAVEYFEYNQIGAWVGEHTPCFISPFDKEELDWE
tara:strand:- start:495 stop:746 length:252 start_codon:yes stop_codon:yes gene_type:complete